MKLLTTGGLLYQAGVNAQRDDGSYGPWQNFDWVATIPEDYNESNSNGDPGVGWAPLVTHTLTTFDGGKLMVGFGSVGGIMKAGWMVKMWGTDG